MKNNEKSISETYSEIYDYINKVKEHLYKGKRRSRLVRKFNKDLERIFNLTKTIIKKNKKLYRSRIYRDKDLYVKYLNIDNNNRFIAYNKEDSWVNKKAPAERMNYKGDITLYVSSDIATTLLEINASNKDYVSVAKMNVNNDLIIADLSKLYGEARNRYDGILSLQIQYTINNDDSKYKYIFPQYVSEICKMLGYDGIGYASKYANDNTVKNKRNGINYAIYDYKKCEPISSDFYEMANRRVAMYNKRKDIIIKKII